MSRRSVCFSLSSLVVSAAQAVNRAAQRLKRTECIHDMRWRSIHNNILRDRGVRYPCEQNDDLAAASHGCYKFAIF